MFVYKLRDPATGLYAKGGFSRFVEEDKGKVWRTVGHLKNHLTMIQSRRNLEIVELELVEKRVIPVVPSKVGT